MVANKRDTGSPLPNKRKVGEGGSVYANIYGVDSCGINVSVCTIYVNRENAKASPSLHRQCSSFLLAARDHHNLQPIEHDSVLALLRLGQVAYAFH